ncbi:MAG: ABC transporter substrate-binding protein, partial [Anaerolineales bacterium]
MKFHKNWLTLLSILLIAAFALSACQPQATPTPEATQAPATEAPTQPVVTEAPTEVPTPTRVPVTRKGGWLDEIVFSVVGREQAITQLQAGTIDVYASGLSSADFPAIKDAGLSYAQSNGYYYDLLFNPAGPEFKDGRLNPFSDPKIREAMNWLIDRNYINQEVYGGGSLPKWLPIQTNGPEYANFVDTARELESKYAYNLDKAKEVISTEMESLGAKLVDGKWTYKDKPVTLIFLIRPDGDGTRKPIGDYVANQLESVGFTVDRQYKKSSEASPIWIDSDPTEGQWHLYTAAWSSTVLSRDEKDMFQQMYLPSSIQGLSVFQANQPDPEFQKLGDDLANGNFKTLDERSQMMKKALELALQDSLQVWLIDGKNYSPYSPKVEVTYDLAAGIEGAQIWPYTVRFKDQEGGQLKWAEPDLFTEPWNPIAGSNWAWDQAAVRA